MKRDDKVRITVHDASSPGVKARLEKIARDVADWIGDCTAVDAYDYGDGGEVIRVWKGSYWLKIGTAGGKFGFGDPPYLNAEYGVEEGQQESKT